MSNELHELLYAAAEDSVASLAFMLLVEQEATDADGPNADGCDGPAWAAEVDFAGPVNGKLVLLADQSVLAALARHMLCLPRRGDRRPEAFRQFVRVVCGRLLGELSTGEHLPQVFPPRILGPIDRLDALADRSAAADARLNLADGRIDLALFIDRYSTTGRTTPSMLAACPHLAPNPADGGCLQDPRR